MEPVKPITIDEPTRHGSVGEEGWFVDAIALMCYRDIMVIKWQTKYSGGSSSSRASHGGGSLIVPTKF